MLSKHRGDYQNLAHDQLKDNKNYTQNKDVLLYIIQIMDRSPVVLR